MFQCFFARSKFYQGQLAYIGFIVLTLILSRSNTASAQTEAPLKINASYGIQTDSNLFRLPTGANTIVLLGRPAADEQVTVSSVGLAYGKTYSLQRLELEMRVTNYGYQNFNSFSFTASNYNAAWRWSITPELTGNLTVSRRETQNSFADTAASLSGNVRTDTNTRIDGAYDIGGGWAAVGAIASTGQTNQLPVSFQSDFLSFSSDAGLRFTFKTGSTLTYRFKKTDGNLINRALQPAALLDDGYRQIENGITLGWTKPGIFASELGVTQMQRSHTNFAQRDFSGLNATANMAWNVTAKSSLSAAWVRELASYQTNEVNYSLTDRFSVSPIWQITQKAVARIRHEVSTIDYLGSPTGLSRIARNDVKRDTTLAMDWQVHSKVTLSAVLQNASRSSSVPGLDYESRIGSVSAQVSY
jgi:exopolysaccharide biosynthesis operon protein EpsL